MIRLFFLVIFTFINLYAHQTGLSYISIEKNSKQEINLIYKKPLGDIKAKNLVINFPYNCHKTSPKLTDIENDFIVYSYSLACAKDSLINSRIWIEGLKPLNRGVIISYKSTSMEKKALLKSDSPYFYINAENSSYSLFIEYIELGIAHILSGYDHLLFVLSLLLIARNLRNLLIAISAFTISHSVTLGFAVYDFFTIPVVFVEAMIAMSIVFLAREILIKNENSLTRKHLEYIAFIFGLLHGFGFSNVLKNIGLPQDDIVLALFSFNIGIELGQVFFITIAWSLLYIIKKYFLKDEQFLLKILGYFIGSLSMFWFYERLASF